VPEVSFCDIDHALWFSNRFCFCKKVLMKCATCITRPCAVIMKSTHPRWACEALF
jgi:hypothetical protein